MSVSEPTANGHHLEPYPANPRYWQLRGQPTLLLGGTDTDAIFHWPANKLRDHLDLLKSVGGNYIRNTMSDRIPERGDICPFKPVGDGRYDLDGWNPEYWARVDRLLKETAARDIVVQIELWDGHDYQTPPGNPDGFATWDSHPLNPKNNVNYTADQTSMPEKYTLSHTEGTHPAFRTIPDENDDPIVLAVQRRFIGELLSRSLAYDHVLYTVQNEQWSSQAWSAYWARFVREKADECGKRVYVAEMHFIPDASAVSARGFDFAELSQSASGANRPAGSNVGEGHYQTIATELAKLKDHPAPANSVKQYGGDEVTWTLGAQEGIDRVWRSVFAGQAAVRFHRPTAGLGLSERAQMQLRSLRMVSDQLDLANVQPHPEAGHLLGDREPNEAYLMAQPGRLYAVYFPAAGRVTLDVSAMPGDAVRVVWLNTQQAQWHDPRTLAGGRITLATPGPGHWAAMVTPA